VLGPRRAERIADQRFGGAVVAPVATGRAIRRAVVAATFWQRDRREHLAGDVIGAQTLGQVVVTEGIDAGVVGIKELLLIKAAQLLAAIFILGEAIEGLIGILDQQHEKLVGPLLFGQHRRNVIPAQDRVAEP